MVSSVEKQGKELILPSLKLTHSIILSTAPEALPYLIAAQCRRVILSQVHRGAKVTFKYRTQLSQWYLRDFCTLYTLHLGLWALLNLGKGCPRHIGSGLREETIPLLYKLPCQCPVPLPLLNTLIKTPKCFVFSCSFSPILWSSWDCHLASDHGNHCSCSMHLR